MNTESSPATESTIASVSPPVVAELKQPSDEWLRLAYDLAWSQYAHEDALRHQKNTLYISIQTALFAILPTTVFFVAGTTKHKIFDTLVDTPTLLIGLLFMGTAIFGMLVNSYWENVIRSGRAWMYLRYATARLIEHQIGLSECGLAAMEHRWDAYCKSNKGSRRDLDKRSYYPFAHIPELKDVTLYPKAPIGESHAALGIVRTLNVMWMVAVCIGTICVVKCIQQIYGLIP